MLMGGGGVAPQDRQHASENRVAVDKVMLERGGDVNADNGEQQRVQGNVHEPQHIRQRLVLRHEIGQRKRPEIHDLHAGGRAVDPAGDRRDEQQHVEHRMRHRRSAPLPARHRHRRRRPMQRAPCDPSRR
jgi:hypothetical protein